MANPGLPDKVLRETLAVLKRCGWNQSHAASELGLGGSSMAGRVRMLRARGHKIPVFTHHASNDNGKGAAQELKRERRKTELLEQKVHRLQDARKSVPPIARPKKRSGKDDFLRVIFPDVHGMYQDREAVGAFMADLKKLAPQEVIGLGDLTDCGGFLAQHHVMGYVAETDYTFEEDIACTNQFLDELQKSAPGASVDLIEGNHDARIEKWCVTAALRSRRDSAFLMSLNAPKVLLNLKDRGIRYFGRSEMHDGLPVQGAIKRGKCVFTHEAKLQTVHRWGLNVVHGHDHRPSMRLLHTVANGTIGIWSLGCLARRQPLWQHGNPTEWAHAYGIQVVARSGRFMHMTIPIVGGESLLPTIKLG